MGFMVDVYILGMVTFIVMCMLNRYVSQGIGWSRLALRVYMMGRHDPRS